MKRKIALPTDFSKNAWHAMVYALELFNNESCDFYIINVFETEDGVLKNLMNPKPGSELFEDAKLESQNGLAKVLDMISFKDHKNPKHNFITMSVSNNPLDGIKNLVEEKDIEMIIMGTRGATNSEGVYYGSTAIQVMEKVRNCVVLVIPETASLQLPKEIVFPTSFKTHFKRRELKYLIEIAELSNASIKILHISEEKELTDKQLNNKALLEDSFKNIEHSYHNLSHMSVPIAINCFVESRESDMVAFINKKHIFFGSILSQPLVKDIGYHSKVPTLVLHDLRN